ncbi:hypothetical protein D3C72_1819990 [compost metagenome]
MNIKLTHALRSIAMEIERRHVTAGKSIITLFANHLCDIAEWLDCPKLIVCKCNAYKLRIRTKRCRNTRGAYNTPLITCYERMVGFSCRPEYCMMLDIRRNNMASDGAKCKVDGLSRSCCHYQLISFCSNRSSNDILCRFIVTTNS